MRLTERSIATVKPTASSWLRASFLSRLLVITTAVAAPMACEDTELPDTAGTAGKAGSDGGHEPPVPQLQPGESCEEQPSGSLTFSTLDVVVAPGKSRTVILTVQPDMCSRRPVDLRIEGSETATMGAIGGAVPITANAATAVAKVDLRTVTVPIEIKGGAIGTTKLTATLKLDEETTLTGELNIDVVDPAIKTCAGSASGNLAPGGQIGGGADLGGAFLQLQANADKGEQATENGITYNTSMVWPVSAFDTKLSCAADIVPEGYTALGNAVTFGPETKKFPRELPMAIPVNPAALPDQAKLRHIRVAYSGPSFKKPRVITVANPSLEKTASGSYVLTFMAPRLGTYQAVVQPDAGTKTFKRRLTHRAVTGVSMGGGGSAMFGLRHHDKFDVIAPLGGPVDWTYMLDQIEKNQTGGFSPNDGETPQTELAPMVEPRWSYEHASTFNQWWYEYPRNGNGGRFPRGEYSQIFRDLALQFGNPNGDNKFPGGEYLPPGVDPKSKAVVGERTDDKCAVWVESIGGSPNEEEQRMLEQTCPIQRCQNPLSLTGFYDREFNPKAKWPVITVCDGSPQKPELSPYANTWSDAENNQPLEVALAVDYNGNGKRDENEPIIRQGHEPWSDVGLDGKSSKDEPGYEAGVNEDPAGDDYDPQYNPTGTEGNGHFDEGEPFEDVGLDGVAGTKDSPYDTGEGDGKFTISRGLKNFWTQDPHAIARQWSTPPGGAFDDEALKRFDIWTDGGTRDLFNFSVAAQHLTGAFAARGRNAAYFTDLRKLPGQGKDQKYFSPQRINWSDIPGSLMYRYGAIDPTKQQLVDGSGQHVGPADEIAGRLQSALYFISSRWPDAPHTQVERAGSDPAPLPPERKCEIIGTCTFDYTDSRGRTGPVTINLPPGYAHKDLQNERYPVIYMLHGYGQTPEDLGAAIIFLSNWMNSSLDSAATRLSRAILVYVDGRCRIGPSGKAECIRGSFYADSPREDGGKFESYFLDLMKEIDSRYRTMPETEIDWEEDLFLLRTLLQV